jgi:very-short-patch-repair endonuclease
MRHKPTRAEQQLWRYLRNRLLHGAKFRRQYSLDRFIVDFVCLEAKLIVEVDGNIHEYTQAEDAIRQDYLESLGYTVLRFNNEQVLKQVGAVLTKIAESLDAPLSEAERGRGVR